MNNIVMFLTGSKGSGKTTVFNMLKDICPDIVEIQLAKKLKDTCAEVFKLDRQVLDDPKLKEQPLADPIVLDIFSLERIVDEYKLTPTLKQLTQHQGKKIFTPRELLQYIGTDVLRTLSPDIHCMWAVNAIEKNGDNNIYVVTDGRFKNEFDFFKKYYKFTFYPFVVSNTEAEAIAAKDTHPSEANVQEVRKHCEVIDNNCNLSALFNNVSIAFEDVLMDSSFTNAMAYSNYPCDGVEED